jgi:hypothetical protein
MKIEPLEIYFSSDGWAYKGVYQQIGGLPYLTENERNWTLLGALLLELLRNQIYQAVIYHDSRLVDEWEESVSFLSNRSQSIAVKIKNEVKPRFLSIKLQKIDSKTLKSEITRLKIV